MIDPRLPTTSRSIIPSNNTPSPSTSSALVHPTPASPTNSTSNQSISGSTSGSLVVGRRNTIVTDIEEGKDDDEDGDKDDDEERKRKRGERTLKNTKRAEQNRAAQRAFRERRDAYVRDLEKKAKQLEEVVEEKNRLKDRISHLEIMLCNPPEKEAWEGERLDWERREREWERERGGLKGEVEALKKEVDSYRRRLGLVPANPHSISPPSSNVTPSPTVQQIPNSTVPYPYPPSSYHHSTASGYSSNSAAPPPSSSSNGNKRPRLEEFDHHGIGQQTNSVTGVMGFPMGGMVPHASQSSER